MENQINQAPKANNDLKMWLPWVILGAVVLPLAFFCWWQYGQINSLKNQLSQSQAVAEDLAADAGAPDGDIAQEPVTDPGTPVSQDNDAAQILSVVDAYVRAPVAAESEKFEYAVANKTGDFARVTVNIPEGGGYALILKKVGDQWTVLFGGQDTPTQELAEKYGLPASYYQ